MCSKWNGFESVYPARFRLSRGRKCGMMAKKREGASPYAIDLMERQRSALVPGQGLSGFLRLCRRGRDLPAGDEDAPGAGGIRPAGLSPILEQRRQGGLFRHCRLYPARAAVRHLRLRPGYPPARGPGHHRRVRGSLSGVLLYAQFQGSALPAGLPHGVGGRHPGIPDGAGRKEAGGLLRRPERGPSGDRPEKSQDQPHEPRLLR